MDENNRLYTMSEVTKYLQLSREKIASLIKDENFPAHKIGNQWRFYLHEINEWVKKSNKDN